jgi:hypothetical protein
MLLQAEFLALTLIVVYVGAVMVLWLFVVMMLDINIAKLRQGFTRYAPLGIADRNDRGRADRAGDLRSQARARRRCAGQPFRNRPTTPTRMNSGICCTRSTCTVRDRGGDPAARDRRSDHADHARAGRAEGAGHRAPRSRCRPRIVFASSRWMRKARQ